jgi:hypothetical protein
MEYFQNFPNILYTFDPNKTEYTTVKNIFARVKVIDDILQNSLIYYQYNVKDEDNAQIIADKYYGETKRHWIVFFANRVVDPYFDMPLNQRDLENNIISKYTTLANAQAGLHHVEQRTVVVTSFSGGSNTQTYVSTLNSPFTYNFTLGQVVAQTLPTVSNPVLPVSNTTVTLSDGSIVTTNTALYAVNNYDNAVTINESKRKIQLLDRVYVSQVEAELTSLLLD